MKRVTLFDTAGGQALGWNPDGFTTTFTIIDTDVTSFLTAFISVEIAMVMIKTTFVIQWIKILVNFK